MTAVLIQQKITLYKYTPKGAEAGPCKSGLKGYHYRAPVAVDSNSGYWCADCVAVLRRRGILELLEPKKVAPVIPLKKKKTGDSKSLEILKQQILDSLTSPITAYSVVQSLQISRSWANTVLNNFVAEGKVIRKLFGRTYVYVRTGDEEKLNNIDIAQIKPLLQENTALTAPSVAQILEALGEGAKTIQQLSTELGLSKNYLRYISRVLEANRKITVNIIGRNKHLLSLAEGEYESAGIPKDSSTEDEIIKLVISYDKQIFNRYEIAKKLGISPECTRKALLALTKKEIIYSRRQGNEMLWYCLIENKATLDEFITKSNPLRVEILELLGSGVKAKREIIDFFPESSRDAISYQLDELVKRGTILRKLIKGNMVWYALPSYEEELRAKGV